MKKKAAALLLAGILAGASLGMMPVMAASYPAETAGTLEEEGKGEVNWYKGDAADVTATGIGLPPEGSGAQGTAMARRAAIVDAQRNLSEMVNGVQLTSDTTMEDLSITSDVVKTHTDALVRGAQVVEEHANADGSYQVTLSIPMYGVGSLASVAVPELRKDTTPAPQPKVDLAQTEVPKEEVTQLTNGEYSGIVVDASGLGLDPTFAPVIYDETGRVVYGLANLDYDFAINHGMVAYASSLSDATRAGNRGGVNPLVIKGTAVRGGRNSTNPVNVVVSKEDGDRILLACEGGSILQRAAVVFIR